jgi:hydroxymethylbilane synthase
VRERIVLGTRGSDLALTQTRLVEGALRASWPDLEIDTTIIKTSGDEGARVTEQQISPVGGRKGLFTAEIERALLQGTIDVAVHSAKDLPSALTATTAIAAVLPRGPVEDVLVSVNGYEFESLPCGATVATGSVRRSYQLRWKRPDLRIVNLRGNVPTRLRTLCRQQWDAAILAQAGLARLGLDVCSAPVSFEDSQLCGSILPWDTFVPAGGQGVIAMQIRSNDERTRKLLEAINDVQTRSCLRAEREFLRLLHGDCNQPVGVFAVISGSVINLHAQVFRPQTTSPVEAKAQGPVEDGERLAGELLHKVNGHGG